MTDLSPADRAKRAAAARAVELVEDGMRLGLGTGSTARWFVDLLAAHLADTGRRATGASC
jgi:ribose 5-phosphate isomerase A